MSVVSAALSISSDRDRKSAASSRNVVASGVESSAMPLSAVPNAERIAACTSGVSIASKVRIRLDAASVMSSLPFGLPIRRAPDVSAFPPDAVARIPDFVCVRPMRL